jgi:hypothetical protein
MKSLMEMVVGWNSNSVNVLVPGLILEFDLLATGRKDGRK